MKISIVGTGYVGLVTGACLADAGNDVLCLDLDPKKIEILESGGIPIHEPGLLDIVRKNVAAGRLKFTTSVEMSVGFGLVQVIAVGTPPDEDGSADLQYVLAAARSIGQHMTSEKIVVDKSTVPVGTADKVREEIRKALAERSASIAFHVVSNPEFLKEGAAVEDFQRPDRIVVGADHPRAVEVMRAIYAPFQRNHDKLMVMDVRSAELTKYAANAMLATRISFMNELANLAESLGADIEQVRRGIGSDSRIGYGFLYAGCGYGGSCFPKDVKALVRTGREQGYELRILQAVEDVNDDQKLVMVRKIKAHFGDDLKGRHFAFWGLSFKPETDDMREAPSVVIAEELLAAGATVTAYDPVAAHEAKHQLGDRIQYAANAYEALTGADALLLITEWREFRVPNWDRVKQSLKQPVVFVCRNIYSGGELRASGFTNYGIGL